MPDLTRTYRRKLSAHIAASDDHWKLFLLQGAGLILLGTAAAILPKFTTLAVGVLIGWLLIISGLFRLASGFGSVVGPGHWSSMLLAALMVLIGAVLALYSKESSFELRVVLAGYLAIHAIASLKLASSLRKGAGAWLAIIVGALVDALLAALSLSEWPSTSDWVLSLYLAVNLVVAGLALIFVALGVKDDIGRA
jgi:uncharacterized membrane protein HdeD (DUF308 family)